MLSRLYAKPDTTRFSVDWVPLIDAIVNSLILNWANILSDNLARVMLPMHQMIFNGKAPRVSKEASTDILSVARWFAEESFTYIRVFESYASPHVLPYYVPDKLLAREIAYQLVNGISKQLKDVKKAVWPNFPLQ